VPKGSTGEVVLINQAQELTKLTEKYSSIYYPKNMIEVMGIDQYILFVQLLITIADMLLWGIAVFLVYLLWRIVWDYSSGT